MTSPHAKELSTQHYLRITDPSAPSITVAALASEHMLKSAAHDLKKDSGCHLSRRADLMARPSNAADDLNDAKDCLCTRGSREGLKAALLVTTLTQG